MHIQSPRIFILSGICPRMSQGCVECVCVERERHPHGGKPRPLSECQGLCQVCGRLSQFAHPRALSRLQGGLAPRSKGKARAPRGSLECNPEIPAFPGEEN